MTFLRNILILAVRFLTNAFSGSFQFDHRAILKKNYPEGSAFYFVQVGANDGITNDDLFDLLGDRNSFGLAIEPVREYYEQLKHNYAFNKNIRILNTGVHAFQDKILLHKVKNEFLDKAPAWAKGIASMNDQHHIRSGIPAEYLTTEEASAAPLDSILREHYPFPKIDLLQIDVEGYDLEVLKMFDFSQYRPSMVKIEYINLSENDLQLARNILQKEGYYCFLQNPDLIGVSLRHLQL